MKVEIRRIFVEKKKEYAVEANGLLSDLKHTLGLKNLTGVRIVNRYDLTGISDEDYAAAKQVVLAEPPLDKTYEEDLKIPANATAFVVELLPGQYDQREDFAEQCIQLISQKDRPVVAAAKVYILTGKLTPKDVAKIKKYCINPVEAQEASLAKPDTLEAELEQPAPVAIVAGFDKFSAKELEKFRTSQGLAMSAEDLVFVQKYFKKEKRDPSITEIKVLDTYWSDHCRHTTFETKLNKVTIADSVFTEPVKEAYEVYKKDRQFVYGKGSKRPVTLMDMAVLATKKLKKQGKIPDLDASEEINACSIVVPIKNNRKTEDWLVMYKNETHNHPTEIEPSVVLLPA